jgi:hypothetical protein
MTNDLPQKVIVQRLETVLIAFFVLAGLFVLVVYLADPSIYTKTLMFEPSTSDRYPLPATLFLVAILVFISVLIFGVLRHWRWLFWLLLVAFGFQILAIPTAILQLTGIVTSIFPVWYTLSRMCVSLIQIGVAVWMVRIFYHYGVWAMGRKKKNAVV